MKKCVSSKENNNELTTEESSIVNKSDYMHHANVNPTLNLLKSSNLRLDNDLKDNSKINLNDHV